MLVNLFSLLPNYTTTQGDWSAVSPLDAPVPIDWKADVTLLPGTTYKYKYTVNAGENCESSTALTLFVCDPDPRDNDMISSPEEITLDQSIIVDSTRSRILDEATDSGLTFPASWPSGTSVYDLFYKLVGYPKGAVGPDVDISILTSEFGSDAATGVYLATYVDGVLQGQTQGKRLNQQPTPDLDVSNLVVRVGTTSRGKFRVLIR